MRHGNADFTARFDDAPNLGQRALIVRNMLQHFRANQPVKTVIGERQVKRIADAQIIAPCRPGLRLQIGIGLKSGAGDFDIFKTDVETDRLATLMEISGMGVTAMPAAQIEQCVPIL